MIIALGNQKGGAGKSTLTLLLANYLTMIKRREVLVMDLDYQESLAGKFEKAKVLENNEPYQVVGIDISYFDDMKAYYRQLSAGQIMLIDLPGKLDDDGLIAVFKSVDLVICPFAYDEMSFESTIVFSKVVKTINEPVPIVYVPNRIKSNVKYETKAEVEKQLGRLGTVTNPLSDRIDFQRITTFHTPVSLMPVILPVFNPIYNELIRQPEDTKTE